jgi:4-hydroxy-3-methylbut-2-enyl diphosphate reductase
MGVRRAVDAAEAELARAVEPAGAERTGEGTIYTLGPLIHNPQVLDSLAARGVRILPEESGRWPPSLAGKAVILRAHGVSPRVEDELRSRGARIVDATCPRVKASQNIVRDLTGRGWTVFFAGERDHAEVRGIAGYAGGGQRENGDCVIAGNAAEAEAAGAELFRKTRGGSGERQTALIAQTTFSLEEYEAIAEVLKKYFPRLEVKSGICGATRDRQEALRKLCAGVDAVVIAGGRDSANTRRLLAIAESLGKPALLAESARDIPADFAGTSASPDGDPGVIGLSAGASTPDSVVEEIAAALEQVLRCKGLRRIPSPV